LDPTYRLIVGAGQGAGVSRQLWNLIDFIPQPESTPFPAERAAKEIVVDSAERCRAQSEECRRLLALAQSKAEASILRSLSRSWTMIANQTDRHTEIMKEAAARK
jgi:hypothetical protein